MSALATQTDESTLAEGFNVLRDWADKMIGQVRTMPDDAIVETARMATELEGQAFRVRGACAAELKRRIRERARLQPENRGNEETVIARQLPALAAEIGVSPRTLDDDARIYETFASTPAFRGDTNTPREVYRLALSAPDPQAAVEMAAQKKAESPNYSTRDFRRDVEALNGGGNAEEVARLRYVTVGLDDEAWGDLMAVRTRIGCDSETAIKLALRDKAEWGK
jgi:hypothetical protein